MYIILLLTLLPGSLSPGEIVDKTDIVIDEERTTISIAHGINPTVKVILLVDLEVPLWGYES